jgi:flavin reductase (DIM6/NTAB) family NADH-FMN oxidoreductase RutF
MDPKIKQKTLRLLSNGMYVLTSRHGSRPAAATVTWVSQASFKPPLLMAAVRRQSTILSCLQESRVAALHILDRRQKNLAQKFFTRTRAGSGPLNGEPYSQGKTSAPILKNLSAYLECKVIEIREEHGDHAIVLLEVVDAALDRPVHPLTVAESPWEYGG